MAMRIDLDVCIQCGVCIPECPNDGIAVTDGIHTIEGRLCTECFGYASEPSCSSVCPVDAISKDSEVEDDEAILADRAADLFPERFPRD
jgi:ferredoxin